MLFGTCSHVPLAVATAQVEVNFAASDVAQRPEFVQNDGGGAAGSGSSSKDRKGGRDLAPDLHDLHDILIGKCNSWRPDGQFLVNA